MKNPFFITGLPRSRTAWLANLFCTDDTVCYHEPHESVTALIDGSTDMRIGVADCTLPMKFKAIIEKYPDSRWLYIDRDYSDSMRSFVRYTKPHVNLLGRDLKRFFDMHIDYARVVRSDPRTMVLTYSDLTKSGFVHLAWHHLLPDKPWNQARYEVLNLLNVQQNLSVRVKEVLA